MHLSRNILVFLLFSLVFSCHQSDDIRKEIDTEEIKVDVKFERLELDLFALTDSFNLEPIKAKYGSFFEVYVSRILNFGSVKDPAMKLYLSNFLKDKNVLKLYAKTQTQFPSFTQEQQALSEAFKRYAFHFKTKQIPVVTTCFSGFTYYYGNIYPKKIIVTEDHLGISLDMYLGRDFKDYLNYGFPKYFVQTMDPHYLTSDAIRGWLYTEFEYNDSLESDFLRKIIYEGKIHYLTDLLLPETEDSLKFGFTGAKMQWCKENEQQMWTSIVNKNLLFDKNAAIYEPYFLEGPFTKDFPKESPARAITYLGYKMIQSYMLNHPEITPEQLMKNEDYKQIFNASKYKPKK